MKKIVLLLFSLVLLAGCTGLEGLATLAGGINCEDIISKEQPLLEVKRYPIISYGNIAPPFILKEGWRVLTGLTVTTECHKGKYSGENIDKYYCQFPVTKKLVEADGTIIGDVKYQIYLELVEAKVGQVGNMDYHYGITKLTCTKI